MSSRLKSSRSPWRTELASDATRMTERILFLTGHLARSRLEKILAESGALGFEWSVIDVGVKVAALMTQAIIMRRLPRPIDASRGLRSWSLSSGSDRAFQRIRSPVRPRPRRIEGFAGIFRKAGRGVDLSRHDMRIFAEIVDAPALSVDAIVCARRQCGRPEPTSSISAVCRIHRFLILKTRSRMVGRRLHRQRRLCQHGRIASRRQAGAQFLLSLTEATFDLAGETGAFQFWYRKPMANCLTVSGGGNGRQTRNSGSSSIRFSIRFISGSPSRWRATRTCGNGYPAQKY